MDGVALSLHQLLLSNKLEKQMLSTIAAETKISVLNEFSLCAFRVVRLVCEYVISTN